MKFYRMFVPASVGPRPFDLEFWLAGLFGDVAHLYSFKPCMIPTEVGSEFYGSCGVVEPAERKAT